jgi:HEAT repeat protein
VTENGPAQSLDEALLAALGEGSGQTSTGSLPGALSPSGSLATRAADGRADESARHDAIWDSLAARGGARSLSSLLSALRSSDDDVAMYAATALGEARDPAAVPHLIRLLQHPDLNVAQAAIDALGKLRAQSAAAPVEAMLEADPWLRFAAAHALGEIGHPGSVHALMRVAGDPAISELAIEALGKIATVPAASVLAELLFQRAGGEGFDGCLLALGTTVRRLVDTVALESSRAWQRLASAEAAPVHGRLVGILVRQDIEPEGAIDHHFLKEAAISVIRTLALPRLYPALVEAAWDVAVGEPLLDAVMFAGEAARSCVLDGLGSTDPDVRVFCCTAAAALGIEEATPACEGLLSSGEARVRVAALRALAGLRAQHALPSMLKCLADPSESVAGAAVRALGSMDAALVTARLLAESSLAHTHASAVLEVMRIAPCEAQQGFVRSSLVDEREDVRRAAVSVLAASENADVIDVLAPLLRDPAASVRCEVIQALGRRRCRAALTLLLEHIERDSETRELALRAIGRIGDGAAARRLVALYPRQDHAIRLAIIDALGAISAPSVEPFLATLLTDAQPEVRSRAVVAIGQYATDGAVTRLVCATRDADARVRLAALEALSAFAGRPVAVESFERMCLDPIPAIAALARRCLRKG